MGREKRAEILALRHQRLSQAEIAWRAGVPRSTVSPWRRRWGLGRLPRLALRSPCGATRSSAWASSCTWTSRSSARSEAWNTASPASASTANRGIGWEFAHVAIDDATRLAYVEMLDDERSLADQGLLKGVVARSADRSIIVHRILTDNGSCYVAKTFGALCQSLSMKHSRTRPYRPRTNGKAERFIPTLQREWAYALTFHSSKERTALVPRYLHFYNRHRARSALKGRTPYAKLGLNNVVGIDI